MTTKHHDAITNGIALLDARHPGWSYNVDASQIAMSRDAACILGQLYGTYQHGCKVLGLTEATAVSYGFALEAGRDEAVYVHASGTTETPRYAGLTAEWKAALA